MFGSQGGQFEAGIVLDLSTCLNGYGPAPAARMALQHISDDVLAHHPYHAPEEIERLYAQRLHVPQEQLVAVRGASEGIWQLARIAAAKRVALPLPTYTEFLKWFPDAIGIPGSTWWHTAEQLDHAAKGADIVMFSNPQNPTGRYVSGSELVAVAKRHPHCLFAIDDSYGDFLDGDDGCNALFVSDVTNVLVLKSPTKFFGIGGVRVGVAWSPRSDLLEQFRAVRSNWPLSMIDACVVASAFDDVVWQQETRLQLRCDGEWLDSWLRAQPEVEVTSGPLHFRLATGDVLALHERLLTKKISTRLLTPAHGFSDPAMRITAPIASMRYLLE